MDRQRASFEMRCAPSALRSDRRADQAIGIIDRRADQAIGIIDRRAAQVRLTPGVGCGRRGSTGRVQSARCRVRRLQGAGAGPLCGFSRSFEFVCGAGRA